MPIFGGALVMVLGAWPSQRVRLGHLEDRAHPGPEPGARRSAAPWARCWRSSSACSLSTVRLDLAASSLIAAVEGGSGALPGLADLAARPAPDVLILGMWTAAGC
jgi:hypothetical protein